MGRNFLPYLIESEDIACLFCERKKRLPLRGEVPFSVVKLPFITETFPLFSAKMAGIRRYQTLTSPTPKSMDSTWSNHEGQLKKDLWPSFFVSHSPCSNL